VQIFDTSLGVTASAKTRDRRRYCAGVDALVADPDANASSSRFQDGNYSSIRSGGSTDDIVTVVAAVHRRRDRLQALYVTNFSKTLSPSSISSPAARRAIVSCCDRRARLP